MEIQSSSYQTWIITHDKSNQATTQACDTGCQTDRVSPYYTPTGEPALCRASGELVDEEDVSESLRQAAFRLFGVYNKLSVAQRY